MSCLSLVKVRWTFWTEVSGATVVQGQLQLGENLVTSFMAGIMKCFTGKQKDLKKVTHRQHTCKSSEVKDSCSLTEYLSEQLCLELVAHLPLCFFWPFFSLTDPWQALSCSWNQGTSLVCYKAPRGLTTGGRLLLMLLSG